MTNQRFIAEWNRRDIERYEAIAAAANRSAASFKRLAESFRTMGAAAADIIARTTPNEHISPWHELRREPPRHVTNIRRTP